MMVQQPSSGLDVKILDLGLAKIFRTPTAQTTDYNGTLLGSIHNMTPGQTERHPLDARTDLYALGSVLYQCLAERPPFDGDSVAENHRCPPASRLHSA